MSTWCIYMLGSTRVHKRLCRPCMPEYSSESWTLHLYVCICICEACERYLSMELGVMKIIGVDFIVVWIFCSFNDVFISSYTFKMFWKLIGLLSNYHNMSQLAPCPYIAPIPVQEPSVMTHTGTFLLKSTGFNIGDCIAITLVLWKHLSSSGVHWKVWLFCADPAYGVVYAIMSGMYNARYCTSLRNFLTSL